MSIFSCREKKKRTLLVTCQVPFMSSSSPAGRVAVVEMAPFPDMPLECNLPCKHRRNTPLCMPLLVLILATIQEKRRAQSQKSPLFCSQSLSPPSLARIHTHAAQQQQQQQQRTLFLCRGIIYCHRIEVHSTGKLIAHSPLLPASTPPPTLLNFLGYFPPLGGAGAAFARDL